MKKTFIAIILSLFSTLFAWETFAEYEVFCFQYGIEPSFEEFEYYSSLEGQCYQIDCLDLDKDIFL